jgi:tetratricopeptide (TPR) repeat protein
MESSPGIPHALHMQAHLATRIGKWEHTTDWSAKAVELEKAYHASLNVKPGEDHQFQHHLETLTRSLVHDGRFAEAKKIKEEAIGYKYYFRPEWIRMAIAQEDWKEAEKQAIELRGKDKSAGAYWAAIIALNRGDVSKAKVELDALKPAKDKKDNKINEVRQWEIEGRVLCANREAEKGLKLLKQCVDKTKNDYRHHAWGNGAVLMEAWGEAALECGNASDASEAFQEALAHDSGSVRGALGMWALCDKDGRSEEAERYLKLAKKCWCRADEIDFQRIKDAMMKKTMIDVDSDE